MPARLVPLTPGLGPPIPLERPVILIGRHSDCDVQIVHPRISRRHCCFAQVGERLVLRDLGSSTGIRINGYPIEESDLAADDEIAIGPILYRLELPQPTPVGGQDSALDTPSEFMDESELVPLDD
jgi:pSer/pThr/pTyr-binding forkhead associated (FHA) protein